MDEVYQSNAQLGQQLSHPIDTAEKVASATGSALKGMVTSDPELLNKARSAWQGGQHIDAARHLVTFLTPAVGSVADKSGDELQIGQYGKAFGHVAAAVLPLLFGRASTAEAAAEESAAKSAHVESEPVTPAPQSIVAKVAPATEAERAANAYLRRHRLTAPAVEVVGANPDAAQMDYARGRTIGEGTAVPDDAEVQDAARQQLNALDKIRAEEADPVRQL